MNEPFVILEHTADVGFRAWGETAARLFENAARALMTIAADPSEVGESERRRVQLEAEGYEELLVDWLSEILYLFDTGRLVPARFQIERAGPDVLEAYLWGERRDPERHPWALIVKAVTYHQLAVRKPAPEGERWEAEVYLDV